MLMYRLLWQVYAEFVSLIGTSWNKNTIKNGYTNLSHSLLVESSELILSNDLCIIRIKFVIVYTILIFNFIIIRMVSSKNKWLHIMGHRVGVVTHIISIRWFRLYIFVGSSIWLWHQKVVSDMQMVYVEEMCVRIKWKHIFTLGKKIIKHRQIRPCGANDEHITGLTCASRRLVGRQQNHVASRTDWIVY